ncbi:MAG: histidine triad nucleotide-binding protein [Anaerolineae bacterium]
MTAGCRFCRIAEGKEDAEIVYQDEILTAFRDIAPQAPTHILLIPNRHIPSLNAAEEDDRAVLGAMLLAARQIAHDEGLDRDGYRLVINTGRDAGQSVRHLHLHILDGRQLSWPPG